MLFYFGDEVASDGCLIVIPNYVTGLGVEVYLGLMTLPPLGGLGICVTDHWVDATLNCPRRARLSPTVLEST